MSVGDQISRFRDFFPDSRVRANKNVSTLDERKSEPMVVDVKYLKQCFAWDWLPYRFGYLNEKHCKNSKFNFSKFGY